jgi:hypothetical protein
VPVVLIGLANNGASEQVDGCVDHVDTGQGTTQCVTSGDWSDPDDESAPADGVPGVWTEDVTGSTTFAPMLRGTPHVSPVPDSATLLHAEVVSTAGNGDGWIATDVDVLVAGTRIDSWSGVTEPHAVDVHVEGYRHSPGLAVRASVTSGSGTVQCRIYAGDVLVAVQSSDTEATCTPVV